MTERVFLILSSAFVEQELAAEFGRLPPSFLPVGMKRLLDYQLQSIGQEENIYLTLPETFELQKRDHLQLESAGVTLLPLPLGLSLGEAVIFACNMIAVTDSPITILHGDTLIDELPQDHGDHIGVAQSSDGYSWAAVDSDDDGAMLAINTIAAGAHDIGRSQVACGYFSFSSATLLLQSLTYTRGDFIDGVNRYNSLRSLSVLPLVNWYDFGHLRTFYRSRRTVTTARHFNLLDNDGVTVRKSSFSARNKIKAEAAWYDTLPHGLRVYTARLVESGENSDGSAWYETEYEYLPNLAELLVFGKMDPAMWTHAFASCQLFLENCATNQNPEWQAGQILKALVADKGEKRLAEFAADNVFSVDHELRYAGRNLPSLRGIMTFALEQINFITPAPSNVMHGDFCFSNILYNPRVRRIRALDPRGYIGGSGPNIYGDTRYDLAKLGHSVLGRYDDIIAGRYDISSHGYDLNIHFDDHPNYHHAKKSFAAMAIGDYRADSEEISAIIINLFLSMLPLHSDRPDRQKAFIANAARLFVEMQGG
ncbi:MAG: capsular biosynthesis protein [Sphingomonadales bacterium]|nr:capsular biosynthesis protein [Sphingomonadales bacterium]